MSTPTDGTAGLTPTRRGQNLQHQRRPPDASPDASARDRSASAPSAPGVSSSGVSSSGVSSSGVSSSGVSSSSLSSPGVSSPDSPSAGRDAWPRHLAKATRAAAPALAAYLTLRLIGVGILAAYANRPPRALLALIGYRYDSVWYVRIAEHGYTGGAPITAHPTDLAFFPLYPSLIAAADPVVPGPPWTAALSLAWLAGLAAAWGLFAIGRHLRDARTGIALAALWAVLPHALVESMAYTEGLFTALAAWTLHALLRRRWLTAAALAVVAGTTRPTAAALVTAVVGAAALAAFSRRDGWRPWVAGLVAPLGLVGYLAFVAVRTGRVDGYSEIQRTSWGLSLDGGRGTATVIGGLLDRPMMLTTYVTAGVLVLATVLLILLVVERWPVPLLVYAAMVLIMTVGAAGYFYSKARLLIPDFPLLLPMAAALAGARPARVVATVVPLALASGWFGAYLALVWRHSP